jgi:hypothetical protein
MRWLVLMTLVVVLGGVSAAQAPPQLPPQEFKDAKLTISSGDKTKEVDVVLRFGMDKMQFINADKRESFKDFAYADCKAAEYSYSKSPRWKSGLLISPFLFMSSGKKHWFMVKSARDYALVHLDKGNYKLVLAEFETRTGLKVEAEGENK